MVYQYDHGCTISLSFVAKTLRIPAALLAVAGVESIDQRGDQLSPIEPEDKSGREPQADERPSMSSGENSAHLHTLSLRLTLFRFVQYVTTCGWIILLWDFWPRSMRFMSTPHKGFGLTIAKGHFFVSIIYGGLQDVADGEGTLAARANS